jgi:hypothetical protein
MFVDLLLSPGAPFAALSLAGVLLAVAGFAQLERARLLLAGVRALPTTRGMAGRFILGQAAAVPLACLLLLLAFASGAEGSSRQWLLVLALGLYLYVGIVLPRRPLVEAQQERRRLRQLTPGFVSYVRVALAGYDPAAVLLERYVLRQDTRLAPMQRLATEALTLMHDRRLRPFEALLAAVRARGCQELTDVAEALAQAEGEGTDPQAILEAQELTLAAILRDEFQRMLKRRTMYLLLLVAIALVVGILGNLLFVMVAGSGVLGQLGG